MNNEIIEIYDSLKSYIVNLDNGIKKVIEKIHLGNENEFLNMIVDVIDGIDWTIKAIYLTKDYNNIKEIVEMNDIFVQVIEGLENKDYILVADIFEYEILPTINLWKNQILK